jgi:hypothetical protein
MDERKSSEAKLKYMEEYRKARKEYVAEYFKEYYKRNKDAIKRRTKKRYLENIVAAAVYNAEYRSTEVGKQKRAEYLVKYRRQNPGKNLARKQVQNALIKGILVRQPCAVCGNEKSQGHHNDYTKPLDVIWLCDKHHKERHKQITST